MQPPSDIACAELHLDTLPKTDDPEILARRRMTFGGFVEASPERVEEREQEGKVKEARKRLRRGLRVRGLGLSAEDAVRVNACNVLDTLERWRDQAIVATNAAEALRKAEARASLTALPPRPILRGVERAAVLIVTAVAEEHTAVLAVERGARIDRLESRRSSKPTAGSQERPLGSWKRPLGSWKRPLSS